MCFEFGWQGRAAGGLGSLKSASLEPQTCEDARCSLAGSPLQTGPERPGSLNLPAWSPRPPWGYRPDTQDRPKHINGEGFGVHLHCLTAERSIAGLDHYRPCIPGGFALPHRSDGTLGRGPRRSRQFRVSGLGFGLRA